MKAQDLKKSILQYAMQGKLVPQNPQDEPASELLKRIKAEKEQLIKEGKIKKEKPLPPITQDEIPYDLPQGWQWVRLGNVGLSNIGLTYKPADITQSDSGIPVLRSSNIQNNKIDLQDLVRVNTEIKNQNLFVEIGDILICARNGSKNLVGKSAIITKLKEPMTFGAFMAIFRSQINNWVKIYLDSPLFKKTLESVNTVTINQITQNNLKNAIIPVPPLAEQKRIVEKLEEILPLVDEYGKNEEILSEMNQKLPKQIRQSILQYAVQGKLVAQNPQDEPASELLKRIKAEKEKLIKDGKIKKEKPLPPITQDEILYDLPQGWVWVRFQDITQVLTCGYASTPRYYENGRMFLSAKNVKPYKFLPQDHKFISEELYQTLIKNGKPELGDILLTRVGAGIGEAAIIDKDIDFAIYVSLTLIKLFKKEICPEYILHWLNSPFGVSKAINNTFGKGCSQGNLNVNQVRLFILPIPPLAEQKRIVAKVEELLNLVNKLEVS